MSNKREAINGAMSIAEDIAAGKLDPAALDEAVAGECRQLFGVVVGEGDPLWSVHVDVTRQAIALGALTADELSEWTAVLRSRESAPPSGDTDVPSATGAMT